MSYKQGLNEVLAPLGASASGVFASVAASILGQLLRCSNPEAAHFVERAALYLFAAGYSRRDVVLVGRGQRTR